MKRFLAALLLICLTFSSCRNVPDEETSADILTNETTGAPAPDETETQPPAESDTETETETETETDTEAVTDAPVKPEPLPMTAKVGTYTVYDPYNTRGLSETHHGYGYGVAKDEKAHSISQNNQKTFDSMRNVSALALDTKSTEKIMYLTFDCGYEYNNNTAKILDILKEKNVSAAFFCTLSFIKNYPDTTRRMINEGHIVGNHSTTHPTFPYISRTEMAKELYGVDEYLRKNFGYENKYFRFPTGGYSASSLELCTSLGYKSVFWSMAYSDWDTANQMGHDEALETVCSRIHPGAVILLHAVSDDNVSILSEFIDYAQAKGYTFATLDDYKW